MELLEQVESYLARTRVPPSRFGRMAVGDPRFVDDLRAGRKLRRKTQERVRRYLTRAQSGGTLSIQYRQPNVDGCRDGQEDEERQER